MTYSSPTLILVGAAADLVLESSSFSVDDRCKHLDNIATPSDLPELW
jgi:hypothetical protein